jgi:mevalonate kinase
LPAELTARAPAKVILFGEHAVNRGQPAIATSVGLYATCTLRQTDATGIAFRSDAPGSGTACASPKELLDLGNAVDAWRAAEDYEAIRRLAAADFYAPHKYVLASALRDTRDTRDTRDADALPAVPAGVTQAHAEQYPRVTWTRAGLHVENPLPAGLEVTFASEIPRSCGLGSGGAAFAALATALDAWLGHSAGGSADRERIAEWAHRGDVVAHGGIASRLDTQTSLCGGAIRYTVASGLGEAVPVHLDLCLVIGNTGVTAATSAVNARVRHWLAENPAGRMRYFEAIGLLAHAALAPLAAGDWPELGRLMTLNQLALEKIGVSSGELERLIDAALAAGALGAKLAGSGGGGIMIALCTRDRAPSVAEAITSAGGTPLLPALAVAGAALLAPRPGKNDASQHRRGLRTPSPPEWRGGAGGSR